MLSNADQNESTFNVSHGEYLIHSMVYNMECFNVPQIYEYNSI